MPECSVSVFDGLCFDPTSDVLGRGKQGIVFRAKDSAGRLYAVKVLPAPAPEETSTPLKEVSVLKRVHHPNCVELKSFHLENNEAYLVLEYCQGEPLLNFVARRKAQHRFSEAEARVLTRQILLALRHIHTDLHCVHGDLKPDNILVEESGDTLLVKVVDFGLSSLLENSEDSEDSGSEVECSATGTPAFMAPESVECIVEGSCPVLRGSRDSIQKTDIFSVGVITYMMLSGHPPFGEDASSMRQLLKALGRPLRFPPAFWEGVSEEAKKFVRTLLELDPVDRPSAEQALRDSWLI